ncbi:MAG: acyl-CoA dehydrogenase family protein [Pseudomonadota bacterium]
MSHTKEFEQLRSLVRNFVETELEPASLDIELNAAIPEALVDRMRTLGLFGLSIPKAYGGLGLTTLEEVTIYEELTRTNACHRSRIGTSNGIGSMGILYDGTDEQKTKYLPGIAKGTWTTAFALTEADAGSDAANISTSAVLKDDVWILNGAKQFITNAGAADLFTVLAVTDPEKKARGGVTAFIVHKDSPGLHVGPPDTKMGLKGSHTHEVVFKDCRVPVENVIGGMDQVGQGFKTAMRVLDKGRLSMGACALGASQKILELCIEALKKPGLQLPDQAIQFDLADMATQIYAARQMLYHAASLRDEGSAITAQASMVKVFCTEMASTVAGKAMDIFAMAGAMTDRRLEMFFRDVRLYRIYEGTSEIQRIIIARDLFKTN